MKKKLNVGMVGYGFMGRTHSNAFLKAGHFFDLPFHAGSEDGLRAEQRAREVVRGELGI